MYALFDEGGKFLAGRVLSASEAALQVELASGKRAKVKLANVLLRFEQPAPEALLQQAQARAAEIDLDLAWECAPDEEFGFADLASDYFGSAPSHSDQAAALLRLSEAPHYFRRAGKGRFRKASAETVQLALAALERKRQQQLQIEDWAQALQAGQCPEPIRDNLFRLLFKPDKNGPEYKAVVQAAKAAQLAPLALLRGAGAITRAYDFHWQRFLFEHFPRGTGFAPLAVPPLPSDLPRAGVEAFSIDDSSTTEIDDALSLQGLGTGEVVLGIHIAAPGLLIQPGDALDQQARARLSTVYMPGHKVTMLPDALVTACTLEAGRDCPALSLYLRLGEADFELRGAETRLERVPIALNLRHDRLDHALSVEWLQDAASPDHPDLPAEVRALRPQLAWLHALARACKVRREQVRGKPETFNRPDYSFRLDDVGPEGPCGDETVHIGERRRGAPLDLMVAEAMILANSTWGQWLSDCGVPGIYRSQASLAPGIKVRMGSKALPHAGIGVPCYAWSTSPLRRYVDLVNQWQLIACVRHGQTAALAAPFKPKDAELFSIISAFDAAYSAYAQFQAGMERYWTLKHLQQRGVGELSASVLRDSLLRADTLPLVFNAVGAQGLPRGARVRVRLLDWDDIALDVSAQVIERLDADAAEDAPDDSGDDETPLGAPVALAMTLDDEPAAADPGPGASQG